MTDAGTATIASSGTLQASEGTLLLGGVALTGGTLTASPNGTIAVGTSLLGTGPDGVEVQDGAQISGFGAINAAYIGDSGSVVAQGGTLDLQTGILGTGSILIDAGATLEASSRLYIPSITFASSNGGTLLLGAPTEVMGTLSGFAARDVIDLKNLVATSLTFMGGTLTLEHGTTVVDSLVFAGSYTSANFTLKSDHNGGTDIGFSTGAAIAQDYAPADLAAQPHFAVDSGGLAGWGEFSAAHDIGSLLLELGINHFQHV